MEQNFTGIAWLDAFLAVMGAWGYAVAFAGALLENLFLAGSFMPGETVVMAVSFAASRDPRLNIGAVWLVSMLGTMAGSNISYWIGHRGGRPLIARITARFPRMAEGLHSAEEYFEIHGSKTVFLARFTAGFKNFVPTLAGVTRMRLAPFEIYTALSAIVYTTGLAVLGYYFGSNLDAVAHWIRRAGVWALVVAAALVAAYIGWRIWRSRRIEAQVEEHEAEVHPDMFEVPPRGTGEEGQG